MLVSYNLLNKYIDLTGVSPHELADLLTNAGLEVEEVKPFAQGTNLVIGEITKIEKHPDSKKLNICHVNNGKETLQIVCGAANVEENRKIILAQIGSELDNAKVNKIKEVKIGGYDSQGMICSLSELGVSEKYQTPEEIEGIYLIDQDVEVGVEALSALSFDDYIIDIGLTPNRSDIYSIYALALEVSALINRPVNQVNQDVTCKEKSKFHINIEDDACSSYCLFEFNNLSNTKSSHELRLELMALGIKPHSKIVDSANLGMVVSGNPIHTFDKTKLKSDTFTIKKGVKQAEFLALDDNVYEILEDDLVIINGEDIVAIAGVIGSKDSAIDDNTTDVVIESAVFKHVSVRETARRLDLFSEASIRFSKIVNPYTLKFPIAIFQELMNAQCSGATCLDLLEYQPLKVSVTHQKITSVLGMEIDLKECVTILENLSFKVDLKGETINAYPPSYRKDVERDVDLIEEIIRIYGYDNIPAKLPLQEIKYQPLTAMQQARQEIRSILVNGGFNEIITYQLNSEDALNHFSEAKEYLNLSNPLSKERAFFRDQLITNMIATMKYNKSYQHQNLALFEISEVFLDNKEQTLLCLGMSGIFSENLWQQKITKADFYLMKGIIFNLLNKLGYHYGRYLIEPVEDNHPYLHPTKSAYIKMNKKIVGIIGEVHPIIMKTLKIKDSYIAQINLSDLISNRPKSNKYTKLNLLPSVKRDLSLVIPNNVNSGDLVRLIKTGNKLVKDVKIFDLYHDDKLEDAYSLALSLTIKDEKDTLVDDQVNQLIDSILKDLNNKLGIKLKEI